MYTRRNFYDPGKIGEKKLHKVFGVWEVYKEKWNDFKVNGELER